MINVSEEIRRGMAALAIETMEKEELVAKRARRAMNLQLLKADTPAKVLQVKMAQKTNTALIGAEDALLLVVTNQPAEALRNELQI